MSGYVIHGFGDLAEPPRATLTDFLASLNDAPWTRDALCAQVDTEIWFPTKNNDPDDEPAAQYIHQAKAICRRCPVQVECLAYAVEHDETHGIWGGTAPRERRHLHPAAFQAPPRPCAREDCDQTIPAWEHGRRIYHNKDCARLANEDRLVARLDHEAVVAAYLAGGISIARLASDQKATHNAIRRILDAHGVGRRRGGPRVSHVQPTREAS